MLDGLRYTIVAFAFSSLILPYFVDFSAYQPHLLRPILNITWAFVFGTHIWYLFFSSDDFYATGGDEGSFFTKKRELQLSYSSDECTKFFLLTLFCNSLIVITTRGLAPHRKYVQYCSVSSLVATIANTLFVPKTVEQNLEDPVFGKVSPATVSRLLSLITCLSLAIYCLL